uniref:Uncharacterized protein n=1 Tax=Meloidogyne enterolobii TaxID=390850 RepID=A0A6V7U7K2_MELEN|nr:unnamed protein product [Meloidogyne enterolobii]
MEQTTYLEVNIDYTENLVEKEQKILFWRFVLNLIKLENILFIFLAIQLLHFNFLLKLKMQIRKNV